MTFVFIILITMIQLSNSQRRLTNSEPLPKPKPYMVYLTKSKVSPEPYDEWICGGVIVAPSFIVTAAACVQDVRYIYVIAGYEKYVEHDKINSDPCTKVAKKKVVLTAVPRSYKFVYNDTVNWASADIAVAKVESPYNFQEKLGPQCSYKPRSIPVNFNDPQLQSPGTHAFMMGWGHRDIWRQQGDKRNYNVETLQFGTTVIRSKDTCKSVFGDEEELRKIIVNDNTICTFGDGKFDSEGRRINRDGGLKEDSENNDTMILQSTRRSGICQNDHGGPLIVRSGSEDILIGVASLFVVEDFKCSEPYFYTSTFTNRKFLYCIIFGLHNNTTLQNSGMDKCHSALEGNYELKSMEKLEWRVNSLRMGSTATASNDQEKVRRNSNMVRSRPQIPMTMLRLLSPAKNPSVYLDIIKRPAVYAGPEED